MAKWYKNRDAKVQVVIDSMPCSDQRLRPALVRARKMVLKLNKLYWFSRIEIRRDWLAMKNYVEVVLDLDTCSDCKSARGRMEGLRDAIGIARSKIPMLEKDGFFGAEIRVTTLVYHA